MKLNIKKIILRKREKECLHNLILGFSAKESAKRLNLSYRTVQYYLETLKNKLDCQSRSQMIQKLINEKILFFNLIIG